VERLPLRAIVILPPAALAGNGGWAFLQRELPVAEWRVWPMARCPWWAASVASLSTYLTSPHLPVDEHAAAVGDGHTGRLLAAVLERVEPVVPEVGDRFPRRPHRACLARMVDT
jgi:hypothetical protein